MALDEATLLNAVTSDTTGSARTGLERLKNFTFWIIAASVTTGATVTIEASPDGTNWFTVHSEAVTANGNTGPFYAPGRMDQVRATVSSRTDGTYTVKMTAN